MGREQHEQRLGLEPKALGHLGRHTVPLAQSGRGGSPGIGGRSQEGGGSEGPSRVIVKL